MFGEKVIVGLVVERDEGAADVEGASEGGCRQEYFANNTFLLGSWSSFGSEALKDMSAIDFEYVGIGLMGRRVCAFIC